MTMLVPALFLAVFIYLLRKTPFIALAPFLTLSLGRTAFIDTFALRVPAIVIDTDLKWEDFVFILLAIGWLIIRKKQVVSAGVRWQNALKVPLAMIIAINMIAIPVTWILDKQINLYQLLPSIQCSYFPLGAMMWADILSRARKDEIHRLLEVVSFIMVPCAIMYGLSSIGWDVFPYLDMGTETKRLSHFEGAIIRRDNLTFPVWIPIAYPFLLVLSKRLYAGVAGAIIVLTLAVSAFKSYIIPAIVIGLLCVIFSLYIKPGYHKRKTQLYLFLLALVLGTVIGTSNFPANIRYTVLRFRELAEPPQQTETVGDRLEGFRIVKGYVLDESPLFGVGGSTAAASETVFGTGKLRAWDSLWTVILLQFGFGGLFVWCYLLAAFMTYSWLLMRKSKDYDARIAWTCLMVILWYGMRSFASAEILSLWAPQEAMVFGFLLVLTAVKTSRHCSTGKAIDRKLTSHLIRQ